MMDAAPQPTPPLAGPYTASFSGGPSVGGRGIRDHWHCSYAGGVPHDHLFDLPNPKEEGFMQP